MTVSTEWWRTLFKGLILDLWRQAVTPDATRAEADFILEILRPPSGGLLLDAPCGFGRHSLELAGRGYRLTGIDLAADYLAEARTKAEQQGLTIDWHHGDIQEMTFDGEFDGVFCCGFSFPYFDDAGNRRFLSRAARALKPGGRFLVETFATAESAIPLYVESREVMIGDILMTQRKRYDAVAGRVESDYTCVRGDVTEVTSMTQLVYMYRDLLSMMQEAGFREVVGYGSTAGEPYKLGSSRLFLTGTR